MLWPRIQLPRMTVTVGAGVFQTLFPHGEQHEPIEPALWRECHKIIKASYSTSEIPKLLPHTATTWDCLILNFLQVTYVVHDLEHISPSNSSVTLANSEDASLSDSVIMDGMPEVKNDSSEDHLYMAGTAENAHA